MTGLLKLAGAAFQPAAALALALLCPPVLADTIVDGDRVLGGGSTALPPYLQCVPYARQVTGVNIHGDARTWWDQAEGRYARGYRPKVGAVMTFKPSGRMELGHVAAVSRIIDTRTVLLRHANWSPINGRRGQIENDVAAVDVSPGNDWSEVRVWFAPLQDLGTTHWPVQGFIYPAKAGRPGRDEAVVASASASASAAASTPAQASARIAAADPIGALIAMRLAERR